MALQGQALTTVAAQLWAGITESRAKLIGLLQGATLRSAADMHALVEEIQAYIAALDTVHGTPEQSLADALGVDATEVRATSLVAPAPAAIDPATVVPPGIPARPPEPEPIDDINSIDRGLQHG
jgi:hypothetical protein